jgi:hypothetical protein
MMGMLYAVSFNYLYGIAYSHWEFNLVNGVAGLDLLQDTFVPFGECSCFVEALFHTLEKAIMLILRHKLLFWYND